MSMATCMRRESCMCSRHQRGIPGGLLEQVSLPLLMTGHWHLPLAARRDLTHTRPRPYSQSLWPRHCRPALIDRSKSSWA